MPDVPARVRATVPVHVGPGVTAWYQPANSRADLPRTPGGQRFAAMDDLLLSQEMQGVLDDAVIDLKADAVQDAVSAGFSDASGQYAGSFEVERGPIVPISDGDYSNPRVSAELHNTAPHAAAVEYGNAMQPKAYRILGKLAERWSDPKAGA